ncbi:zinc finger, CCHC-type containing protein [Tanacetum coccineum]
MGTVAEYQSEFEILINRVTGISQSLLKSFYISGFKLTLQIELLRARPTTLGETFYLAGIIEAHLKEIAEKEKEKEHIIKKKADTILSLRSELASPDIKGSLDGDEDIGVDEVSSAINGVFDIEISAGKEVDIGFSGGCDKPLHHVLLYSWDGGFDVCVDLTGSSPFTQTEMVNFVLDRVDSARGYDIRIYVFITVMDVKKNFLNGKLEEEVYMNQSQGFIMPGNKNKVCKLIKSLYGLKHASKQWHQKFDEVVLSNGYLLNQANKCVYSKFDEYGILIIKVLYKGHGEVDVILGIRIKHESNRIVISQSQYTEKVLKKFNYFDCTPVSTPMDTSEKLMPNNGQAVSQLEYSRVIGCLMYTMTCTRLDIAFAVEKLSKYTSNPGT